MKHMICEIGDVPPEGEARVFPFFGREVQVWRRGDHVRAATIVCLHLGGPLECKDGASVCLRQGAQFDMADGRRIDGPVAANARLMILPTRVEDGTFVYVWGEPS